MKILSENSLVDEKALNSNFEKLLPYIESLTKISEDTNYVEKESSINLPFDEDLLQQVIAMKQKMATDKLKYMVVIGIGGPNLGSKSIYDALHGHFDTLEPKRFPKIIFLDTNDSEFIHKLINLLKLAASPEEILVNVISKSGTTIETTTNLEILEENYPELQKRLVVTTGGNSPLEGTNLLTIPKPVGGRYSVFSPFGLFPLTCVGVDVLKLREGARESRKLGLNTDLGENPSALSAIITYENYRNGKAINDTFLFHPELESLGKWYRQLLSESVGKDGKGITSTVSIGSSDLHSISQLYFGGPKDKFLNLVNSKPLIKNSRANKVMGAIYSGVRQTFIEEHIPFLEIELENTAEKGLGQFMQFKMMEIMYLGKLMEVNAFDQPDVEKYKANTRKVLSHNQT